MLSPGDGSVPYLDLARCGRIRRHRGKKRHLHPKVPQDHLGVGVLRVIQDVFGLEVLVHDIVAMKVSDC